MSKIICDVCGTSYPETAAACPICGCARPNSTNQVSADGALIDNAERNEYTYVRGGRFSKKNVRKRMNQNSTPVPAVSHRDDRRDDRMDDDDEDDDSLYEDEKSTKGLTIAVLALLAAIVAVVIYLAVRFFAPDLGSLFLPSQTTVPVTTTQPTTVVTTLPTVPCTGLTIDDSSIDLTFVGDSWQITAQAEPLDTTDTIQFFSSNEEIAVVTSTGEVRSVGEGNVVITVMCGEQFVECYVNCTVVTLPPETTVPEETVPPTTEPVTQPTTEPTTEPTTAPTEPAGDPNVEHINSTTGKYTIRINGEKRKHYDISVGTGDSFTITLVDKDGNKQDVTWSASNSRASISGNKVTCKSSGTVKISCVMEGEKYTCIVRISG